jgi:hypothetical protein
VLWVSPEKRNISRKTAPASAQNKNFLTKKFPSSHSLNHW